jgi:hypothetical protein
VRQAPDLMICGLLPQCSCRQGNPLRSARDRTSGRNFALGLLPSTITCRTTPRTEIRLSAPRGPTDQLPRTQSEDTLMT